MTLNDIRNRSGLLILVIGVAMLGFILTDNEMKLKQLIAELKDNNFQTLDLI